MYNLLSKRGQLFAFALGVIVVVLYLVTALGGIEEWNALSEEDQLQTGIFNTGLGGAVVMTLIGAFLFLVTVIVGLITNPKGSIKIIAAFALVAILFAIFYGTAVPETTGSLGELADEFGLTDNQSKIVTAGLKSGIVLTLGAFGAFIVTELINLFK